MDCSSMIVRAFGSFRFLDSTTNVYSLPLMESSLNTLLK